MDLEGEEHLFLKKLTGTDDFESVFTSLTLTGDLTVEGLTNLQDTLDMGSAQIKDMANATATTDAVTLGQMNTELGNYVKLDGTSEMTGDLVLGGNNIKNLSKIKGTDLVDRMTFTTAGQVTMNSDLDFGTSGTLKIINPRSDTTPDDDSNGTRIPQTSWVQKLFLRFGEVDSDGIREHVVDNETKKLFITRNPNVTFDVHFNVMSDSSKSSLIGLMVGGTKTADTGYRFRASSDALQLQVRDSGSTTVNNAIRIKKSNGYVGISVNPPTVPLDVSGQIKSSYNPLPLGTCYYDFSSSTVYGRNVTSVTRNSTGNYTILFSTTLPSTRYAALASLKRTTTDYIVTVFSTSTTNALIVIKNDAGVVKDNDFMFVALET